MQTKKRARDEYKVVRRDLLVALPPFPEAMFAIVKFFLGWTTPHRLFVVCSGAPW